MGTLASMPGQTMGFSVFIEILMQELHLTRDQISLAYMIGTISSGFLLPWGGVWFDRLGARKMMVLASTGLGLVCLYFSWVDRLWSNLMGVLPWAGAMSIGFGISLLGFFCIRFTGQGMMSMVSTAMLGKWFHYRRGLAQSSRGVVISIGFSATPLVLNALLEWIGWQATYRLLAITCGFVMAGVAYVFFRDNPEESGLTMDGDYRPQTDKAPIEDLLIVRDFNRGEALGTFSFWVFNLTFAVQAFWITGYTFHIVSIGESLRIPTAEILALFLPISVVGVAVNFTMGWLSEKTRLKYLLGVMNLGQVIGGLSILLMPGLGGKLLFILGLGISGGGFGALSGVVWPRFFGRSHLGAINGFFMSTTVISSSLGPIFFSLLYTQFGHYQIPFLAMGVISLSLGLASLRADNPQRKLKA